MVEETHDSTVEGYYSASEIQRLDGLEAVRQKPGMYIGGTDERALHHCVWFILQEFIDEHLEGTNLTKIDVSLGTDGAITVDNDGPGVPVVLDQQGISTLERYLTDLHRGATYSHKRFNSSYLQSVNGVSSWFRAEVLMDGKTHALECREGKVTQPLQVIGESSTTGTRYSFIPDPTIFKETQIFIAKRIFKRLRELAALFPKLTLTFLDRNSKRPKQKIFQYKKGLADYLRYLRGKRKALHRIIQVKTSGTVKDSWDPKIDCPIEADLCFQLTDPSSVSQVRCFTNSEPNPPEGTHLKGLKAGVEKALKVKLPEGCLLGVISLQHTKHELGSNEALPFVRKAVYEKFSEFLRAKKGRAEEIVKVICQKPD